MAEIAQNLPKWQAVANPVPNDLPIWQQQILCQKIFFFRLFFFVDIADT
jgi:hypothetical protein